MIALANSKLTILPPTYTTPAMCTDTERYRNKTTNRLYLILEVSLEGVDGLSSDAAVKAARVSRELPSVRERSAALRVVDSYSAGGPLAHLVNLAVVLKETTKTIQGW